MRDGDDAPVDPDILALVLRVQRGADLAAGRQDALASSCDALALGLVELGKDSEAWQALDDSNAALDASVASFELNGFESSVSEVIRREAKVNIFAAADQLRGFTDLLRAERSLIGAATVARGAFESSVWAAAVLDVFVAPEMRFKRALARRVNRLLAGDRIGALTAATVPRERAAEVASIVTIAEALGWKVVRRRRDFEFDGPLSVDFLHKNLETRMGLEEYAWTTGSALAHGEHEEETANSVAMWQEMGFAPAWAIRHNSIGAWAGPRLLLASLSNYTGSPVLLAEFKHFEQAFWAVGPSRDGASG